MRTLDTTDHLGPGFTVEAKLSAFSVTEAQGLIEFERTGSRSQTVFQIDVNRPSNALEKSARKQ